MHIKMGQVGTQATDCTDKAKCQAHRKLTSLESFVHKKSTLFDSFYGGVGKNLRSFVT